MTRLEMIQTYIKAPIHGDPDDGDSLSLGYNLLMRSTDRETALKAIALMQLDVAAETVQRLGVLPEQLTANLRRYDIPFLHKLVIQTTDKNEHASLLRSMWGRIRLHAKAYGFREEELATAEIEMFVTLTK